MANNINVLQKLHRELPVKYKNNISALMTVIMDSQWKDSISRIYLFGSCAKNEVTEDSDIDVCVIFPSEQEIKNDMGICIDVERGLDRIKAPAFEYDLTFGTEQDMEAAYPCLIYHDIKSEGVLLYESAKKLL
jgi:predicted nucleotidyltransferase